MNKRFEFKDLWNFEVMLFPKIATICYRVLIVISVLIGFISFIRGIGAEWGGEMMIFSGLAMITIVPFSIRLWFEFLLVLFMINDRIGDIRGERPRSKDETTKELKASSCKGCGAELEPNVRFCASCGLAVN